MICKFSKDLSPSFSIKHRTCSEVLLYCWYYSEAACDEKTRSVDVEENVAETIAAHPPQGGSVAPQQSPFHPQ